MINRQQIQEHNEKDHHYDSQISLTAKMSNQNITTSTEDTIRQLHDSLDTQPNETKV